MKPASALLLVAPVLLAARSPRPLPPRVGLPSHAAGAPVRFDRPGDGTLWARGQSYKACFDSGGATYIPYLGPDAPRNYPLELKIESVTLGGRPIPFRREASAALRDAVVSFDRGPFAELYALRPESVEQMFRLDERLAGAGDLVLRISARTELTRAEAAPGFRFSGEHGGVHYGEAFALGALGRRQALPARLDGDAIEIRVPESALAESAYPLLLDPVISSFGLDGSASDDFAPDAAFGAGDGNWCVVWERPFSFVDHDVFSIMVSADGSVLPGTALWIDVTTDNWRNPRIAYARPDDLFLVVAERGQAPNRGIHGRTRDLVSAGSVLALTQASPGDHRHPAVGGDAHPLGPGLFHVVWEREYQGLWSIGGTRRPSANPSNQLNLLTLDVAPTPLRNPAISRSAGMVPAANRSWGVAWERERSPGNHDIYATWLGSSGGPSAAVAVHSSSVADTRSPAVSTPLDGSGTYRRFVVAYEYDTGLVEHVFARTAVSPSDGVEGLYSMTQLLGFPNASSHSAPSADSDGSSFTITFAHEHGAQRALYAATFNQAHGSLVPTETELVADTNDVATDVRVASARSGGGPAQDLLLVWSDAAGGGLDDTLAATYRTPGLGENYCSGGLNSAGTSARISASGTQSIYHNAMQLEVSGAPAHKPGLFFLGTAPVDLPFGEGRRCAGGPVGRIAPIVATDAGGHAHGTLNFDLPYGGLLDLNSPHAYYQFWYRDPQGGPSGFNLSDALHVEHTF